MSRGADGSTLLYVNAGFAVAPLIQSSANYDPLKDVKPVCMLAVGPSYVMISGKVPATNLQEFIAWAKKQPNGITAANAGAASIGQILTDLFAKRAGIKINQIPYKGSAETATALIAGDVDMQFTATTSALNDQAKAGRVRILASGGAQPSPLSPGVPTIASVIPGFVNETWYGVVANAKAPDTLVEQYADAFKRGLQLPAAAKQYADLFLEVRYRDPRTFSEDMRASLADWKQVVEELHISRV
jgi:tripartite-type tricarboxylate transporter receptor subunit TctC